MVLEPKCRLKFTPSKQYGNCIVLIFKGGRRLEQLFKGAGNRTMAPRAFVYPWTKNTLPREIFKLVDPSVLAKGFKYAIFDDFSKKHKGPPWLGHPLSSNFFQIIRDLKISFVFAIFKNKNVPHSCASRCKSFAHRGSSFPLFSLEKPGKSVQKGPNMAIMRKTF